MRPYLWGILTVLVVLIVGGFAVYWFALVPMGADASYFPMEKKMANHMVNTVIAREEPAPPYPFGPATDALTRGDYREVDLFVPELVDTYPALRADRSPPCSSACR